MEIRSLPHRQPLPFFIDADHNGTYFTKMVGSFGTTGPPPTTRRMLDTIQKLAAPPHAGVAREEVVLLVGGVEQRLEVVRQERHLGGTQAFWRCPRCEVLRSHLYVCDGVLACRCCHRLDYRSRHVPAAVARAARLRRRLGAGPGVLAPIPPRHPRWRRAYYARLVAELAAAESVLAAMLGATVRALERRKGRLHGPR